MGCWNHTCAVTNLPIYEGEEVEVILLKTSSFPDKKPSYCYPDEYHQPILFTFHGIYDDSGSVEDCSGAALKIIIDNIRNQLVELEVGENKYHDIEVKRKDFDVDYMFRIDHESRFYINNEIRMAESPQHLRLKHIVVRKDVYDQIVEKTTIDWWMGSCKYKLANLDTEQFTKDIDDFINIDNEIEKIMGSFRGVGESITNSLLSYEGQGLIGVNRPINVIEILKHAREFEPDTYDELLDNAVRFAMFNHFMNDARKSYVVPSGVGSQNDDTKSQELCARLTLSSAKAQRKWCKERYEE